MQVDLPLHNAIRKKDLSTVKKTIDKGEKDLIERLDKDNRNALHVAAEAGNADILKYILKNNKNKNLISAQDKLGNSALLLACEGGHRKCVEELLKAGSNTLVVNNAGQTVLHCLLGAPFWRSDHTKILKLILEKPQVEINRLNNESITAIQMACVKGNYDAGVLLMKCKADPTIVKGGEPPLFSAVYAENPALVRELLTHGADISQPNSKLQTLMEIVNPKCEIYRIIKKHLLSRPGGERKLRLASEECIVATNVSQLPPDLKRIVEASKLKTEDIEANWEVFCNVIHFVGKKRIFPNAEEASKAQEKTKKSHNAPDKMADETRDMGDQLISSGNPKKIYKKLRIAGKGGFGMVFQGTGPDKKSWAIKRMPHSSEKEKRANLVEANFLKNCSHPNIVSYKASYYSEEEHELWVIMEMMEGGTLDEAVGEEHKHHFEEKHLAFAAREVLKGLEYLHGKGIAHRDLKAQNVMMSIQGDVKLIDFGLAIELHGGTKVEMCGSPYWLPPEMIMRQPHSYPCDIWSMAVCVLELANRHPPNNDSALRHMFNVATKKPPTLDKADAWSDSFKDFLQCCLQQDQTKRATASELLKHRFISKAATGPEMAKLLRSVFISHQIRDVAIA